METNFIKDLMLKIKKLVTLIIKSSYSNVFFNFTQIILYFVQQYNKQER